MFPKSISIAMIFVVSFVLLVACVAPSSTVPSLSTESQMRSTNTTPPQCIFDPNGSGFASRGGGEGGGTVSHGSLVWSTITETLRINNATLIVTSIEPTDPVVLMVVDKFTVGDNPIVPNDELWQTADGYILLKAIDIVDFDKNDQVGQAASRIVDAINTISDTQRFTNGLQKLVINMSWVITPCETPPSRAIPTTPNSGPMSREEEIRAICGLELINQRQELSQAASSVELTLCDPDNPNWWINFKDLYESNPEIRELTDKILASPEYKIELERIETYKNFEEIEPGIPKLTDEFIASPEFGVELERIEMYKGNLEMENLLGGSGREFIPEDRIGNSIVGAFASSIPANEEDVKGPLVEQTFGNLARLLNSCFYPELGDTPGIDITCPEEWQHFKTIKTISVAAAGNQVFGSDLNRPYWPGRFPGVVSVSDSNPQERYSPNKGEVRIDGQHPIYTDTYGTSFAAPRFSLLAAKYLLQGGEIPCATDPETDRPVLIYPPLGMMPEIALNQPDMWENDDYQHNMSVKAAAERYCTSFPSE